MKNRICISVGKGDIDDALRSAERAEELADVIEIRLDLIEKSSVQPFLERVEQPLLFTNRASWEGGEFSGSEEERIAPLIDAIERGAAYIDLELEAPASSWGKVLIRDEPLATRVICSWHNFTETPKSTELDAKLEAIMASGADIGKIVTMARDRFDILRVLGLIERAQKNDFPLIAFCMGEKGILSRISTCSLGGYMTYCVMHASEVVAPGQITAAAMRTIHLQFDQ